MIDLATTIASFLKSNGDTIKAGAVVAATAGGAAAFFWRRLAGLAAGIGSRLASRLRICVISTTQARRFDDFIELYHQIFSSDERVSTKEIHDWLNFKAENEGIQYRLFLALENSKPAAVAISFFDYSSKVLFIPYMGISELDVHWSSSRRIVSALIKAASREAKGWNAGFVEIADPDEPGLPIEEVRRRRARIRRLTAFAARDGLTLQQIDVAYVQPTFSNDIDQLETCGMLLFALLKDKQATSIPTDKLLSGLEFVYQKIYRVSFNGSREAVAAYEMDLRSRIELFRENLGAVVPLRA